MKGVTTLRRWFDAWVKLSSEKESGAAMAMTRILVALCVLWLVLPMLLSDAGRQMVRFAFADVRYGGYHHVHASHFLSLFGGARPEVLFGWLGVAALAAGFLLVGRFGRSAAFLAAIATRTALTQATATSGGGDSLLGAALLLLIVGDSTATLSLDARARTGSFFDDRPVVAWPRLLGLFQLVVVYTSTGLQKLVSTTWTPVDGFSAIYQILQSPQMARFPDWVPAHGALLWFPLAVATAVTLAFELGFWTALVWPRLRAGFALLGLGLHVGIALALEVGVFSWLSLALYPLLFPELLARWNLAQTSAAKGAASAPASSASSL
jgi:hypothetical protein